MLIDGISALGHLCAVIMPVLLRMQYNIRRRRRMQRIYFHFFVAAPQTRAARDQGRRTRLAPSHTAKHAATSRAGLLRCIRLHTDLRHAEQLRGKECEARIHCHCAHAGAMHERLSKAKHQDVIG
jgi:hypothetical protein